MFFLNVLGRVVDTIFTDPNVRTLFLILPTPLLLASVISAYKKGRVLGLAAVIVAYIAGLSVLVSVTSALLLLLLAIAIGCLATNRRLVKNHRTLNHFIPMDFSHASLYKTL